MAVFDPAFEDVSLPVRQGSAQVYRHEPAQFARDVGHRSGDPRRRVHDSVQAAHVGVYSRHLFAFGFAEPAPIEHPVFETHRKAIAEEEPRLFLDPYPIAFKDAVDGDGVACAPLRRFFIVRHAARFPFHSNDPNSLGRPPSGPGQPDRRRLGKSYHSSGEVKRSQYSFGTASPLSFA